MRKYLAAILLAILPLSAAAQVIFPNRGGTGTGTIPTIGQVLVGQSNGTYAPQATSTLGIIGGSGSSIGTDPLTLGYFIGTSSLASSLTGTLGIGTTTTSQLLSLFKDAADAAISFATQPNGVNTWVVGVDSSDASKFKISSSTILGTNDRFVINGSGNVGIGISAPTASLHISGTYAGSGNAAVRINPTWNSSVISTQYGLLSDINFNASGASLSSIYGFFADPTIAAGAQVPATFIGSASRLTIGAAATGTITSGYTLRVFDPSNAGVNPITNYYSIFVDSTSNGNGTTTGSIANYGIRTAGHTAAAGFGGTITNYGGLFVPPTGSGQGVTTNYGVRISGDGGSITDTASTTNWALYVDSQAPSYIEKTLALGDSGKIYPSVLWVATSSTATSSSQVGLRSARAALTSGNLIGGLDFYSNDTNLTAPGTKAASIQAVANTTHTASALGTDITFSTTDGLNTAERMRITGLGRLGLGTTAPTVLLDVATTSADTATIQYPLILRHDTSGTPAANFGIGMRLVGDSDTVEDRDMFVLTSKWADATDAGRDSYVEAYGILNGAQTKMFNWGRGSNPAFEMYGTNAATTFSSASNNAAVINTSSGEATWSILNLFSENTGNAAWIGSQNDSLHLGAGNLASLVMTIASSTRVGIGTTTPMAKLSVAGDTYISGNLTATGTATIGTLSGVLFGTTGVVSASTTLGASALNTNVIFLDEIDTSSELRTLLTDEVGTGNAMFGITSDMTDDISCGASEYLRRNAGDSAWECATVVGGGGGGSPGNWASTTGNNPEVGEVLNYTNDDVLIGGSSSSTAEMNFDVESATLTLASTTNTSGYISIGTTSNRAALNVVGDSIITGVSSSSVFVATSTTATSSAALFSVGTAIRIVTDFITDITGFGLAIVNGALGLDTTGAVDEECLTYEDNGAGADGIEWQSCASGGAPGGSDTQIQFNDGGAFAGAAGLIWNKTLSFFGIGTSTPSATLAVQGGTWDTPVFRVASTSGNVSDMFTIYATSSGLSATLVTQASNRIAIGDGRDATGRAVPPLFNVTNYGTIRQEGWATSDCSTIGFSNVALSADGLFTPCPAWNFVEDATAVTAAGAATADGGYYFTLGNVSAANDGFGVFLGNAVWMKSSTNTPIIDVTLAQNGAGTSTNYFVGFNNTVPSAATFETLPTTGCYLTASSTRANWILESRTSLAAYTSVDTGIASSTTIGGYGKQQRLIVSMDNGSCNAAIQSQWDQPFQYFRITSNIPSTTALNFGIMGMRSTTVASSAAAAAAFRITDLWASWRKYPYGQ